MAHGARVTSIDTLLRFRAQYADFGDRVRQALGAAESDVQRTMSWLQSSQLTHWKSQATKRQQKVALAKSELFRAELASRDERPSCVMERKALKKAQAELDDALQRVERVKYWLRALEREFLLYRGQTQGLGNRLHGDVPKALARLRTLADQLDQYVKMAPPSAEAAPPAPSAPAPDAEEPEGTDP